VPCDKPENLEHRANDKIMPRSLYHGRKENAMEKAVKTITIGAVAIVALIYGGVWAILAETIIALTYIFVKNA